ncbi:MAG: HAMP domain-containing protein [Gammaproteobacteria bacterium]|nr:HAMP domain-containing protein [Gammaproteobacteria bacterium]
MSLSLRLNVALTLVILIAATTGTWSVIRNARQSVHDELFSSIDLAAALIELWVGQAVEDHQVTSRSLIDRLAATTHARHLTITLESTLDGVPAPRETPQAPRWYVGLIEPKSLHLMRRIEVPGDALDILLLAEPADEIDESWREARGALGALLVFALLGNLLVVWVVRVAMRPLASIAHALTQIEDGHYGVRLPKVGIPDIDEINQRFNQMAEVRELSAEEVAHMAQRALVIREEERRKLAHELHDEMGQSISAIKALAVSIGQRGARFDPRIKHSADTIAEISTQIYDRARQMMSRLRPTILDEFGLIRALEDLVDAWNAAHAEQFCSFAVRGEVPPLAGEIGINLYRIVQEALTNISKHAAATNASVVLEHRGTATGPGTLMLTIADDGVGFSSRTQRRGLGLVGIYERVRAVKGELDLATAVGAGTQFVLRINI